MSLKVGWEPHKILAQGQRILSLRRRFVIHYWFRVGFLRHFDRLQAHFTFWITLQTCRFIVSGFPSGASDITRQKSHLDDPIFLSHTIPTTDVLLVHVWSHQHPNLLRQNSDLSNRVGFSRNPRSHVSQLKVTDCKHFDQFHTMLYTFRDHFRNPVHFQGFQDA